MKTFARGHLRRLMASERQVKGEKCAGNARRRWLINSTDSFLVWNVAWMGDSEEVGEKFGTEMILERRRFVDALSQ